MLDKWFNENNERLISLSQKLWENPELSEKEVYAAKTLKKFLDNEGFSIQSNVGGLSTAFSATWGSGSPRIGFLAEYDALPGLSQEITSSQKSIDGQMLGHGCGHNLLGIGAVGAGMALKAMLEDKKMSGTVVIYGCPAEEIMMGKIVMTKEHVFDALDVALTWHPDGRNIPSEMSYQAMLSLDYTFSGKASHAAMAPEEGLSALDAVELMNVGANYLREHMPRGGQIHYVITNGGDKPNIVPEKAAVWYFIRANSTSDVQRIASKLKNIADGAALMTGTTVTTSVRTGCNETRIVPALVNLMDKVMKETVQPQQWTEEELTFSQNIVKNLGLDKHTLVSNFGIDVVETPLHNGVVTPTGRVINIMGSSDISDVSWVVPTGMIFAACYPMGTPNHTWAVTACSGMSIGQKGMLYAAKVLAATGMELASSSELLNEVKQSFIMELGKDSYKPVSC